MRKSNIFLTGLTILLLGCANNTPNTSTSSSKKNMYDYKQLGYTKSQYYGITNDPNIPIDFSIYGAYYCGDGECKPSQRVDVLVEKSKFSKAIRDIKQLDNLIKDIKYIENSSECAPNIDYDDVELINLHEHRAVLGLSKRSNTVCLSLETYPNKEPEATLSLRKLNSIVHARRPGGGILPHHKRLGLTSYEYYGLSDNNRPMNYNLYGIYYVGDGPTVPSIIHVLVYKNKATQAINDIKKMKHIVKDVKYKNISGLDNMECQPYKYIQHKKDSTWASIGLSKNINLQNTGCLVIKTHKHKESETVIAVRTLDSVIYSTLVGGISGGVILDAPAKDFADKSITDLIKENNLDIVKLDTKETGSLKRDYVSKE